MKLQEVFDQPKEFIFLKVLRLNFGRLGDTRAKERVQNHLLARIKEASAEEMARDDLGNAYPLTAPPSRPSLQEKKLSMIAFHRQCKVYMSM